MIWKKIQFILDRQNKTAYWLAKETGISETMIYSMQKGKSKDIGFTKMIRIADALGVSLDDLREEKVTTHE